MLKIDQIKTAKLLPYVNNTRTHSEKQVEELVAIIREFGFNVPIILDEVDVVIAGHGRLLAAQALGMDEVPVIRLTHLSDRQKRAWSIADNKVATLAGWDFEKLAAEMDHLVTTGYDLELTAFSESEIDALLKQDKDILPPGFIEPQTVTVSEHERAVNKEAKAKVYEWRVIVEASSKSDAKKKMAALVELGYTCVILKDGN